MSAETQQRVDINKKTKPFTGFWLTESLNTNLTLVTKGYILFFVLTSDLGSENLQPNLEHLKQLAGRYIFTVAVLTAAVKPRHFCFQFNAQRLLFLLLLCFLYCSGHAAYLQYCHQKAALGWIHIKKLEKKMKFLFIGRNQGCSKSISTISIFKTVFVNL